MKRINFALIQAEKELSGARQAMVCLCFSTLTASGAAIGLYFDAMPTWAIVAAIGLVHFFLGLGYFCAERPHYNQDEDND